MIWLNPERDWGGGFPTRGCDSAWVSESQIMSTFMQRAPWVSFATSTPTNSAVPTDDVIWALVLLSPARALRFRLSPDPGWSLGAGDQQNPSLYGTNSLPLPPSLGLTLVTSSTLVSTVAVLDVRASWEGPPASFSSLNSTHKSSGDVSCWSLGSQMIMWPETQVLVSVCARRRQGRDSIGKSVRGWSHRPAEGCSL